MRITINGRSVDVERVAITYDDIERIVMEPNPSVTYKHRDGGQGILVRGDVLAVSAGLVINAYRTGNA